MAAMASPRAMGGATAPESQSLVAIAERCCSVAERLPESYVLHKSSPSTHLSTISDESLMVPFDSFV
jgi:hypothetical protein